jgi:hypothetical protein
MAAPATYGAGDRTPIVLLHAVAVSSPGWYASVGALGAAHPVYAVDTITDAGRSTQSAPVADADASSRWLDEVLVALGTGRGTPGRPLVRRVDGVEPRLPSPRTARERDRDPPGALARGRARTALAMVPDAAMAKVARVD